MAASKASGFPVHKAPGPPSRVRVSTGLQPWLARAHTIRLGLRTHLIIFGLAIVVPVLLYSAFVLHRYAESERDSIERRALEIARGLSNDVDREIVSIITTLETLATSPSLARGALKEFRAEAKEALRSRPWNVVLIGANNRQLVNTRLADDETPPMSASTEPPLTEIVRRTKAPYVSNLFVGTVARTSIFAVAVPVRVGNDTPYALVMSLEPDRLVEILGHEALPVHWVAGVADRENIIMARSSAAASRIGRRLSDETLQRSGGLSEGVITTHDADGQEILLAFRVSRLTGWRVGAWSPLATVRAPLWRAWNLLLLSGAALLGLSLLLALGLGRLMAAPIAELSRAGTTLAAGAPVTPISSTLREANELSEVLSTASRELLSRMRAQAHLAAIVAHSPSAMVSLSPTGIIQSWNPAAERLFGYSASEVVGRSVRVFYPEDKVSDFDELNAAIRAGETVSGDVVRRHKDGSLIDVFISVAPMVEESGRVTGISAIISDVAERKGRERQIEFLMRELSHRSKNMLAVVQAVAGQTARHTPDFEAFQARFAERLHAMARSQDLLVESDWRGAHLSQVLRTQLAPFADEWETRVAMSGPNVQLKPDCVQSLALAVHELATNAAKYGALSAPAGRIVIDWELSGGGNGAERRLRVTWRERNGPRVEPPDRHGFGQVVIEQMVASSLHAEVKLEYRSDGLFWSLDAPAEYIVALG
ncbi:MAG TPA: HWE histidine kinase domain-containing protein [Hyphomicrobiaceae bacterium]|nr:HWE histidine kinase domain-containing protein [Hyphomicrobiaceae bacterium]